MIHFNKAIFCPCNCDQCFSKFYTNLFFFVCLSKYWQFALQVAWASAEMIGDGDALFTMAAFPEADAFQNKLAYQLSPNIPSSFHAIIPSIWYLKSTKSVQYVPHLSTPPIHSLPMPSSTTSDTHNCLKPTYPKYFLEAVYGRQADLKKFLVLR